jgi:hypothetical protein
MFFEFLEFFLSLLSFFESFEFLEVASTAARMAALFQLLQVSGGSCRRETLFGGLCVLMVIRQMSSRPCRQPHRSRATRPSGFRVQGSGFRVAEGQRYLEEFVCLWSSNKCHLDPAPSSTAAATRDPLADK